MKADQALDAAREMQLVAAHSTDVMFHGLSMDPLLFEGDRVCVEPLLYTDIKIGDIVTYRYLDRYPTRRVVGINPDHLVLWCDAWPDRIFEARQEDVLGRVSGRTRDGHRLDATDSEWIDLRNRALRRYRRARSKTAARRFVRGARRRLRLTLPTRSHVGES